MPFSVVIGYFFQQKLHERIKLLYCCSGCSFLCKEIKQKGKLEFERKIPYKATNMNPQSAEVSIQFSAGSSTDSRNMWNKWMKVGVFNVYGEKYGGLAYYAKYSVWLEYCETYDAIITPGCTLHSLLFTQSLIAS